MDPPLSFHFWALLTGLCPFLCQGPLSGLSLQLHNALISGETGHCSSLIWAPSPIFPPDFPIPMPILQALPFCPLWGRVPPSISNPPVCRVPFLAQFCILPSAFSFKSDPETPCSTTSSCLWYISQIGSKLQSQTHFSELLWQFQASNPNRFLFLWALGSVSLSCIFFLFLFFREKDRVPFFLQFFTTIF